MALTPNTVAPKSCLPARRPRKVPRRPSGHTPTATSASLDCTRETLTPPGHRLVDEDRLAGGEDGLRLLQVGPPVHAFEQDEIHALQQFVDGIDDGNAVLFPQLFRIAGDTVSVPRNVRAAAGVRRHDADAA